MLSAAELVEMQDALDKARVGAEQAEGLVPGRLTSWWSSAIGADSTTEAIRANAIAARNLYDTMAAKFERLKLDPDAGSAEAAAFIAACGVATENRAAAEAADQLKPTAAVAQVATGTLADLKAGAKWGALLGGPVVILALLAFLVWRLAPRRAA